MVACADATSSTQACGKGIPLRQRENNMDVYPRTKVWPYLLLIGILIALVIGVPLLMRPPATSSRFWTEPKQDDPKDERTNVSIARTPRDGREDGSFRPYTKVSETAPTNDDVMSYEELAGKSFDVVEADAYQFDFDAESVAVASNLVPQSNLASQHDTPVEDTFPELVSAEAASDQGVTEPSITPVIEPEVAIVSKVIGTPKIEPTIGFEATLPEARIPETQLSKAHLLETQLPRTQLPKSQLQTQYPEPQVVTPKQVDLPKPAEIVASVLPIDVPATTATPVTSQTLAPVNVPQTVPTFSPRTYPPLVKQRWPKPTALVKQLDQLQQTKFQRWSARVAHEIQTLRQIEELESADATEPLKHLVGLSRAATRATKTRVDTTELLRPAYGVERRLALWTTSHHAAKKPTVLPQKADMRAAIDEVRSQLQSSDRQLDWERYLGLEDLYGFASDGDGHSWHHRSTFAMKIVARMNSVHLDSVQRKFLKSTEFTGLQTELYKWIGAGDNLPGFLAAIESYEDSPTSTSAAALERYYNSLLLVPKFLAVRNAFETHYRNANLRVSISQDLIERVVPSLRRVATGIRQTVDGAAVRGQSNGWSQLRVQLVPDDSRVRLNLVASGSVQSRTVSAKGPVRLSIQDNRDSRRQNN